MNAVSDKVYRYETNERRDGSGVSVKTTANSRSGAQNTRDAYRKKMDYAIPSLIRVSIFCSKSSLIFLNRSSFSTILLCTLTLVLLNKLRCHAQF